MIATGWTGAFQVAIKEERSCTTRVRRSRWGEGLAKEGASADGGELVVKAAGVTCDEFI